MLRKFLPVCAYTANLVMLHICKPGAYMERLPDPQPSTELVLGFSIIENIAGKYCVGCRRGGVDQVASKPFLKDCFARVLS